LLPPLPPVALQKEPNEDVPPVPAGVVPPAPTVMT